LAIDTNIQFLGFCEGAGTFQTSTLFKKGEDNIPKYVFVA